MAEEPGADKGADTTTTTETPDAQAEDKSWQRDPGKVEEAFKGLRSEIASVRNKHKQAQDENTALKTELNGLKTSVKEKEDAEAAKRGEFEKLYKDSQEELTKRDERLLRQELKFLAAKEGIIDPADVASISLEGVKFNKAGDVEGAAEAIAALKQSKPHWFKQAAAENKTETDKRPEPRPTGARQEPQPPKRPATTKYSDLSREDQLAYQRDFVKRQGAG